MTYCRNTEQQHTQFMKLAGQATDEYLITTWTMRFMVDTRPELVTQKYRKEMLLGYAGRFLVPGIAQYA